MCGVRPGGHRPAPRRPQVNGGNYRRDHPGTGVRQRQRHTAGPRRPGAVAYLGRRSIERRPGEIQTTFGQIHTLALDEAIASCCRPRPDVPLADSGLIHALHRLARQGLLFGTFIPGEGHRHRFAGRLSGCGGTIPEPPGEPARLTLANRINDHAERVRRAPQHAPL